MGYRLKGSFRRGGGNSMNAWFPFLLETHVSAVAVSGMLFFMRGIAINLFSASWPMEPVVRYLSYTVDTVLLIAALMLTVVVQQYPFVNGWLTIKVFLLAIYVVLGSIALKRGRTRGVRLVAFGGALTIFALIITVAHTRSPMTSALMP
jgi:uncharacterized membrane protein SirB2